MSKIEKLIQLVKESKKIVAYSTEYEHDEYGEFTGDETEWRNQYLINYERTECTRTKCYNMSDPDETPVWTESQKTTMTIDEAIDDVIGGWIDGYGFDAETTRIVFTKLDGTIKTVNSRAEFNAVFNN